MFGPLLLLVLSIAGLVISTVMPAMSDLIMLAGPCAVASVILLLTHLRGRASRPAARPGPRKKHRRRPKSDPRFVVIDGSNVIHWNNGVPELRPLRAVLATLTAKGYSPGVVFDANVGYKLQGSYLNERSLALQISLPEDKIFVVPKGNPADAFILDTARRLGAPIISNDRYRDWADDYPEVQEPGRVVRGQYQDGVVSLEFQPRAAG